MISFPAPWYVSLWYEPTWIPVLSVHTSSLLCSQYLKVGESVNIRVSLSAHWALIFTTAHTIKNCFRRNIFQHMIFFSAPWHISLWYEPSGIPVLSVHSSTLLCSQFSLLSSSWISLQAKTWSRIRTALPMLNLWRSLHSWRSVALSPKNRTCSRN